MTESEVRYTVAHWGDAYKGIAEGSTQHKYLVDLFNDSGLCTRYTVKYTDAWCAVFFCDPFIALGLTDLIPIDCGCSEMITKSQKKGIWTEDDAHVPQIGEGVLYDWQDATGSKSDNTGNPDHIGMVQSVDEKAGSFTVLEGNKNDTVGIRTMQINGTFIRGFICPDYESVADGVSEGTGGTLSADEFDEAVAGTYTVTASDGLNLRYGAGTKYGVIATAPKGTKARCYGYYSKSGSTKWLCVQAEIGGTTYTGFASEKYLEKNDGLPTYKVGTVYTTQVDRLNVRKGPGTSYGTVGYSGLTSNGKLHAYSNGSLKKGTAVTCKATQVVGSDVWMQIPSGWIAAWYGGSYYVK